jgi:ubiquinone/menaquinone biosynthesis C-methylase UbiE
MMDPRRPKPETPGSDQDILRLRKEYADRRKRFDGIRYYSSMKPANLFAVHQRQRAMAAMFSRHGKEDLSDLRFLEIGCGNGGVMLELISLEAAPEKIFGLDLLKDRLLEAGRRIPSCPLANADGRSLPFRANAFDVVLQFTAFSSILDDTARRSMAAEMLRVLKPGGLILWYDFWLNPVNRQTKGIRKPEIRSLFPGCSFEFRKITFAPPVAKKILPISWILCSVMEKLKLFNTHYLAGIRKCDPGRSRKPQPSNIKE